MQRTLCALGLFAALAFSGSAHADSVNLHFSGSGDGYDIAGTITAISSSDSGAYQITGISGSGDGANIVSLLGSGQVKGNDNLLYTATGTSLDASGVSFLISSGSSGNVSVNLFADPTSPSGYSAFLQSSNGSEFIPLQSFTTTTPSQVTPEPSSLWLLGTGLLAGATIVARRFRRQHHASESLVAPV